MKLNDEQKELISNKLLDLANLIAGATVIGQLILDKINWPSVSLGAIAVIVLYFYGLYIRR